MLPDIEDTGSIGDACLRVMLRIALAQDAPDREAMLAIMLKDGHLDADEFARLVGERVEA